MDRIMKKKNRLRLILSLLAIIMIAAMIVVIGFSRRKNEVGNDKDTAVQQSEDGSVSEQDDAVDISSDTSEETTSIDDPGNSGQEGMEESDKEEYTGPALIENEGDIVITVPDEMGQDGL